MISATDWWAGLSRYNAVLFPFQLIVMAVAAILTLALIFRPGKISSNAMKGFLSVSMLFNGFVFFILLGTHLPAPLKYIQGGLFILIGLLFAADLLSNRYELQFTGRRRERLAACLLLVVVAFYPLMGLLRGHNYTQLIYPGTLPCGSTAFALVILTASQPSINRLSCLLLLVWAIPFAPVIQIPVFRVYEDSIMVVIGIYALFHFLIAGNMQKSIAKGGSGYEQ